MNIKAYGKYSKHIAIFAKLLHLPSLFVSYENIVFDDVLKKYYEKTSKIIFNEIKVEIKSNHFENIELQNFNFENGHDLLCDDLEKAEKDFIKMIEPIFNITEPFLLEKSIYHLVNRRSNEKEIIYHTENNTKKNINAFIWICILNLCEENKAKHFRKIFWNAMQKPPTILPKIAVILCGYLRNHKYPSHQQLINNPNIDVFIHTWDDYGFKNDKRLINQIWLSNNIEKIDIELIKKQYNPIKIKVENNKNILQRFSLKDKISPIFLYSGQAKDDATKYIQSQLYSIHKAYELVVEHEKNQNFKYDGIIRLRFDYNIQHLDLNRIYEDMQYSNVYFPDASCNGHRHSGGGGGCLSCDHKKEHIKHTNDICDIWFYGKRDSVSKACEVYLNAFCIINKNHEQNMKYLKDHKQYSIHNDFVYISNTRDIEDKFVCFYPERLLRENLEGISCLSSKAITGRI